MKIFEALWIREDSKRDRKTPNMVKPWLIPWFKKFLGEAARQKLIDQHNQSSHGLTVMVPTDHGGPHGLAVVAPIPPSPLASFVTFCFSHV